VITALVGWSSTCCVEEEGEEQEQEQEQEVFV
jgi:hypothetical protein